MGLGKGGFKKIRELGEEGEGTSGLSICRYPAAVT